MLFNIYINSKLGPRNHMNISKEKLDVIINAYFNGLEYYTLSGLKHSFKGLIELKIFTSNPRKDIRIFERECIASGIIGKSAFRGYHFTPQCLKKLGTDVTEGKIGNIGYGEKSENKVLDNNTDFINIARIEELKRIKTEKYDLARLIKLCEEINDNYNRKNYQSVGMIGRTITNHIPPIFGFHSFKEVVNNYGGTKENKSFKNNISNLQNSLKNIADRILHQTIREKETLPNSTQVEFRQDLDVLLEEVVRILK